MGYGRVRVYAARNPVGRAGDALSILSGAASLLPLGLQLGVSLAEGIHGPDNYAVKLGKSIMGSVQNAFGGGASSQTAVPGFAAGGWTLPGGASGGGISLGGPNPFMSGSTASGFGGSTNTIFGPRKKRRSMNPLNAKALARADRRLDAAKKAVRKLGIGILVNKDNRRKGCCPPKRKAACG